MTAPFTSKADFYEGSPIWEPAEPVDLPAPQIDSLVPNSTPVTASLNVTVIGSNFVAGTVTKLEGGSFTFPTTYVSATELTVVLQNLNTPGGSVSFYALNPDGKRSSPATLPIV